MNEHDPELEDFLRRYRPGDPPAGLRERIIAPSAPQTIWPWAAAAAVLLASVLTSRMATLREASRVDLGADPSIAEVANLAEALGGDADARASAESIVLEARLRSDMAPPARELEGEQP